LGTFLLRGTYLNTTLQGETRGRGKRERRITTPLPPKFLISIEDFGGRIPDKEVTPHGEEQEAAFGGCDSNPA